MPQVHAREKILHGWRLSISREHCSRQENTKIFRIGHFILFYRLTYAKGVKSRCGPR